MLTQEVKKKRILCKCYTRPRSRNGGTDTYCVREHGSRAVRTDDDRKGTDVERKDSPLVMLRCTRWSNKS